MAGQALNCVTSAVTGELTSRVFSGLIQRYGKDAATSEKLQRLDMLLIMIHSAIEASEKHAIENSWLLRWRDKLKEAAEQGDQVLARFLQQVKDAQAIDDGEANQQQGEAASSSAAAPARAVSALSFTRNSLSGLVQGICGATKMLFWRVDDDMERLNRTLGRLKKLSSNMAEFIRLIHLEALPTDVSTPSPTRVHGPTKTRKRRKTSTGPSLLVCSSSPKSEKTEEMPPAMLKRNCGIELSPCELALSLALVPKRQQFMPPQDRLEAAFAEIFKAVKLADSRDLEDLEWLSCWDGTLREANEQGWDVICATLDAKDNQETIVECEQQDELSSFVHRLEGLVRDVEYFNRLVHLYPAF